MNIVVINLERRADRLKGFMKRWPLDQDVDVFAAVDLSEADVTQGQRGCRDSHLEILRAFTGPLVVLEDDAIFAPGFTLDITPPVGWDIAWLGGQHETPPIPVAPGWGIPTTMHRTHAYMVRDPSLMADQLEAAEYIRLPAFKSLNNYVIQPHMVGQAGTSTVGFGDCGDDHHFDEFWWN